MGKRLGQSVLVENRPMMHVFEKMFPELHRKVEDGVYNLTMRFGETNEEKAS